MVVPLRGVRVNATPPTPVYLASTTMPSMHLVQGELVVPSTALSTYGGSTTAPTVTRDVQVKSVARGLENDPYRIYSFVRDNIEFEPIFGAHKGSTGTLLDHSGGAFDQATLLVDLLREAGYTATYEIGTVSLGPEAQSILRTTSAAQTCQLLADGGTPATINGSQNCSTLSGAVTSLSMLHAWVKVHIGSSDIFMDPSLKSHTQLTGIDLWSAMGTSSSAAWGSMTSGVSLSGNVLSGLSLSNVNTVVSDASANLLSNLKTTNSGKSLGQVIGGWSITPDATTPSTSVLSGHTASVTALAEIPNQYRATLQVTATGFSQTLDLPTYYGQRMQAQIAWYSGAGAPANPYFRLFVRRCQGIADSTARATCGNASHWDGTPTANASLTKKVVMAINHPWTASSGAFGDQTVTRVLEGGKRADLLIRVGENDGARYSDVRDAQDRYLMRNYVEATGTGSARAADANYYEYAKDGSAPALGETRVWSSQAENGASEIASNKDHVGNLWWALFGDMTRYAEGLSGSRIVHQHSLGIVISPMYAENVIDVDTSVGVEGWGTYSPHQVMSALAAMSTIMEGAAIKELAVERTWASNSLGVHAAGTDGLGVISGVSASVSGLTGGGSVHVYAPGGDTLPSGWRTGYRNQVEAYRTAGFTVVAPELSSGTPTGFYARRSDGSEAGWIVYQQLVDSGTSSPAWGDNPVAFRKGAISSTSPNAQGMLSASAAAFPSGKFGNADLGEASSTLSEKVEAKVGQGAFPYTLAFQRSYRSSGYANSGGLGPGWTHSFASGGHYTMCILCYTNGATVPGVARTIVTMQLALTAAAQDGGTPYQSGMVVAAVANQWGKYAGMAVDLTVAGTTERFLQVASGVWLSTSASGNTMSSSISNRVLPYYNEDVAYASAPRFTRVLKDGSSQLFIPLRVKNASGTLINSNEYAISTWTWPRGATGTVVTYSYLVNTNGNIETLRSVSNNLGATMTFGQTDADCTVTANYAACQQSYANRTSLSYVEVPSTVTGTNYRINFAYESSPGCDSSLTPCVPHLKSSLASQDDPSAPKVQRNYTYVDVASQSSGPASGYSAAASDYVLLSEAKDADDTTPPVHFNYEGAGGLVAPKVQTALQYGRTYTYYAAGAFASSVQDAVGGFQRVKFDRFKRGLSYSDGVDRTSTMTYDGQGRVISTKKPWGDRYDFEYDANSNVTKSTHVPYDPTCEAQGAGGVLTLTHPCYWWGQTIIQTATYDSSNRLTSTTDPASYDDPTPRTTTYSYDGYGNLNLITNPVAWDGTCGCNRAATTGYTYDTYGRVVSKLKMQRATETYAYGGGSSPTFCLTSKSTSSPAYSTTSSCDAQGNTTSVTDPRSYVTSYEYAPNGAVLRISGTAVATESRYVYDTDARVTTKRLWDSTGAGAWRDSTTTYSESGAVLAATDPLGHTTRACYDNLDRVTVSVDEAGRARKTFYNAAGDVISTEAWWRMSGTDPCTLTSDLPPGQSSHIYKTFYYNGGGMLQSELDANGNAISYTYEQLGRLIRTTYADGTTEAYLRDQRNTLYYKQERDSGTTGTRWVRTYTDPMGRTSDTWELVEGATYPDGRFTRTTYDSASGAVLSSVYVNSGGTWATFQSYRSTYYDGLSRIGAECIWYGDDVERCYSYEFDGNNNRTRITWPNAQAAIYTYDAKNRVTQVAFSSYGQYVTYAYDGLSRVSGITRSNGTSSSFTFNTANQVTAIGHVFAPGSGAINLSYGYDDAGKVTSANITPTTMEWAPPTTYARSYGAANALNQVASEAGAALTYDIRGNMTSDGVHSFTYDTHSRMTGASGGGLTASYLYDAADRRIKKSVNGAVTYTDWSAFGEELTQHSGVGNGFRTHIVPSGLGTDDRVAMQDKYGNASFFHTDRQGSVIAVSAGAGNASGSTYSPYGELQGGGNPAGYPFGYAGREYDAETGNYYNRARYYSPRLGQFMQADPIGTQGGPNLYGYVEQDPINSTDPSGHDSAAMYTCMSEPGCRYGENFNYNSGRYITATYGSANINIVYGGGGAAQVGNYLVYDTKYNVVTDIGGFVQGSALVGYDYSGGFVSQAAFSSEEPTSSLSYVLNGGLGPFQSSLSPSSISFGGALARNPLAPAALTIGATYTQMFSYVNNSCYFTPDCTFDDIGLNFAVNFQDVVVQGRREDDYLEERQREYDLHYEDGNYAGYGPTVSDRQNFTPSWFRDNCWGDVYCGLS